ncbi:MAG: M55 family metallopeptidase [Clostridia bacterium]|nr:M55 family metallopeptidase [Clostridia bacterium]
MKKLFISADIEGTTGIPLWAETENGHPRYGYFAKQMTAEVSAACEGATAAGCEEVLIKDAHDSACNLIPNELPEYTRLFRGWGSDCLSMMAGLDETFDGVFFTGYHSGAGMDTNPLSHTMNQRNNYLKINGIIAPELMVNSLSAAYFGVPVRLVTGDKGLCDWMHEMNPNIETVAVSEGVGRGSISIHPDRACKLIREAAERAALKPAKDCMFPMPDHFTVEICFKEHFRAKNQAMYPGCKQTSPTTLVYEADDWMEVLRMIDFVL